MITVFGRKPVLEALQDRSLEVDKLFLAKGSRGETVAGILALAAERGVPVHRRTAEEVGRISRDGRHDQGVALDVKAPRLELLASWLEAVRGPRKRETFRVLLLDGVHNPQNVGMILRSAVAFGLEGVVVPERGCPEIGPYVIKASAGVAFRAPILRTGTSVEAAEQLKRTGFRLVGLDARTGPSLDDESFPSRVAFALGNETTGLGADVRGWVDEWRHIAMAGPAESLNVAVTAAIVAYAVRRATPASGR